MSQTQPKFCLTRADEGEFAPMTGLRDWLKIRDLGLREATGGQYDAWITRAVELGGSTGPALSQLRLPDNVRYQRLGENVLRRGRRVCSADRRFCLPPQGPRSRFHGVFGRYRAPRDGFPGAPSLHRRLSPEGFEETTVSADYLPFPTYSPSSFPVVKDEPEFDPERHLALEMPESTSVSRRLATTGQPSSNAQPSSR